MSPVLEVEDLRTELALRTGVLRAVDGVSFVLDEGRTLGVVGETGSGKSMTALSIMGLLPRPQGRITAGTVRLRKRNLAALSDRELQGIRGREIGMIFQDPMTSLHPSLTIGVQVQEVLRRHLGLSKRAARVRAIQLLSEVEIPKAEERIDDYPHHFSGGMRQRVTIAMAIACRPKLLIADEPTTALDVSVQAGILRLLSDLQRRHGTAILLITHDMGVIAEMADEVLVLYAGQVVEQAQTQDLFERPEHPYTEALLGALPRADTDDIRRRALATIPGRPPLVTGPTSGCRFAPRCPYANHGPCANVDQELREVRTGHWVRSAHPASERSMNASIST